MHRASLTHIVVEMGRHQDSIWVTVATAIAIPACMGTIASWHLMRKIVFVDYIASRKDEIDPNVKLNSTTAYETLRTLEIVKDFFKTSLMSFSVPGRCI